MEIIRLAPDSEGVVEWPTLSDDKDKRVVVSVGNYDGFHKGHQAVIDRTVELANKHESTSAVILFDPRPAVVHRYAAQHDGEQLKNPADYNDTEMITSINQRLELLEQHGIDYAIVVRYTLEFAAKSYIFFLGQLVGKMGMRTLVLGQDASMGKGREGDIKAIGNLAAATGVFELDVVDDFGSGTLRLPRNVTYEMPQTFGEPQDPFIGFSKAQLRAWSKKNNAVETRVWSSSNVRYLLSHGRVCAAAEILGRNHVTRAEVVHGEHRGRKLGFPTANLSNTVEGFIPVDGVYAGWIIDSEKRYPSAISIGTKETFAEESSITGIERTIEAYAIGEEGIDFYHHTVDVEYVSYLRPQIRYNSAQELINQLKSDCAHTLEILKK